VLSITGICSPLSSLTALEKLPAVDGEKTLSRDIAMHVTQPVYKSKIKIVWTTCKGQDVKATRADRFRTLEKAEHAAREYSLDRGYRCEAFFCETCRAYHVRQAS
jgi:hypothetical protein